MFSSSSPFAQRIVSRLLFLLVPPPHFLPPPPPVLACCLLLSSLTLLDAPPPSQELRTLNLRLPSPAPFPKHGQKLLISHTFSPPPHSLLLIPQQERGDERKPHTAAALATRAAFCSLSHKERQKPSNVLNTAAILLFQNTFLEKQPPVLLSCCRLLHSRAHTPF